MADIINSDNGSISGSAGIKISSDGTGSLEIQTVNTAAITIGTNQDVTFNANSAVTIPSGTTADRPGTPVNGMVRYNSNTAVIEGYANSTWVNIGTPPTPAQVSDANNTSTGYFSIPLGTTEQRPADPQLGSMRWNSNTASMEVYVGSSTWSNVAASAGIAYPVQFLLVAGGGAGGSSSYGAGGGGAGGVIYNTTTVIPGTSYSITIGGGGVGITTGYGTSGGNSSFSTIATAIGGGAGGRWDGNLGTAGGSGGGSGASSAGGYGATLTVGGSGTAGQGNAGGGGYYGPSPPGSITGGGGGGAGAKGANGGYGNGATNGPGGSGLPYSISGTFTYYGGGGGAGGTVYSPWLSYPGGGGQGGGGPGGYGGPGVSGTNNSGGGGGGCGVDSGSSGAYYGGNGGSGVFYISYSGPPRATGGIVTTLGTTTVHLFTSSGTFIA